MTGVYALHAKFMPRLLLCEQKKLSLDTVQDMLECASNDSDFSNIIITDDESWVYGCDLRIRVQLSQWKTKYLQGQRKLER